MRLVVLESPYAGNLYRNVKYARLCVRDCLRRGEAPIASHLLYTQHSILDDEIPADRKLGMRAGWAWIPVAAAVVVYEDLGISGGMSKGIAEAERLGIPIEHRKLKGWSG